MEEVNAEVKEPQNEKKKPLKMAVIIIIALIAVIFLFGPSILAGGGRVAADTDEAPVFSVRGQEVQRQTLTAHLEVNGDVVSTVQAEAVPDVGGILVAVSVNIGDFVTRGQVIAMVDPSRPGLVYQNSPVIAPISGIVSSTPLSTGTTVGTNTGITTISLNDNLEIKALIPERDIGGLDVGLKAEVSVQAHPGVTFSATVNRVSPIVDSISRTKLINLEFDHVDHRINAGMFARIRLNTLTFPNVLTVPAESVVSNRGADVVFVIITDNEGNLSAERREVTAGVSLQGWTEIREGLRGSETVVVQGQRLLGGGESLRIIGTI